VPTENKAEHWRSRAAEALTIAEQMTHPEAKAMMVLPIIALTLSGAFTLCQTVVVPR
jgi:hypothetical protein